MRAVQFREGQAGIVHSETFASCLCLKSTTYAQGYLWGMELKDQNFRWLLSNVLKTVRLACRIINHVMWLRDLVQRLDLP